MRRRRSLHFVPGGNEKMLLKALALPADGLILDLEDAVPPDRKAATRPVVRDWLSHREFGGRERWVRMNPIWGPLGRADLEETIVARPDGYVVPKPRHAGDVRELAGALDRLEQRHGIANGATRLTLIATETPEGLLNIREVRGPERAPDRVHPDPAFSGAELSSAEPVPDHGPRRDLPVGRHRVLEVEDQPVGGERERLREHLLVAARHEVERAPAPAHQGPRLRIIALRRATITTSPCWFFARCSKVTMPHCGRERDSRLSTTSVSA